MDLAKLVQRYPTSSHRCIPNTTQRRALHSDLEDGELQKMMASPLYMQSREDCGFSRMPIAPGKPAALLQERGASAKRTQADARKGLMSSSYQEPSAPEKPAAVFSLRSEEPGNQFKSSVFKHADPSNLGRSLLECNKDHLLSQAKSELMRQEHQVGSLNNCISELQRQWKSKDRRHRTHNTDLLNLDENKFVHKKNYL